MELKEVNIVKSYTEDKLTGLYQKSVKNTKKYPGNKEYNDGYAEGIRQAGAVILNFLYQMAIAEEE